ncbi:hypothetical protein JCM30394_34170 [Deferrisoma palaeochoriense]
MRAVWGTEIRLGWGSEMHPASPANATAAAQHRIRRSIARLLSASCARTLGGWDAGRLETLPDLPALQA